MIKGFRDFILRGNVIELAIAVVIGSAFTALVGAFTANIINPVIASAGGVDAAGWGFPIRPGNDATFVDVGAVLTAIITFLITAAVVYFLFVVPMNRANARLRSLSAPQEPEEEPTPVDIALLTEMRDLLKEMSARDARP
ncbi:large conductance mechanosensitive channel protein MscL [Arthrobacter bussei]|jgi:large conductance mechanosensitive channel|uniref:Large-conductance mechanosensitive channel n=1 Tax=Arthrobacter bussei TaxID=2594179 RepID=A0A7X1NPA0_9MICC|nr:large conductance mechanosensitive channel protein MscL [Arthrobacter bussei]MPY10446.1 large conductance mechanosensitive channel protein MscL [Arthrobacter bussei]